MWWKVERGRNKTEAKQLLPTTIAHHALTDAQLVPKQWLAPFLVTPPLFTLGMTFYGMEYAFDKLWSLRSFTLQPWQHKGKRTRSVKQRSSTLFLKHPASFICHWTSFFTKHHCFLPQTSHFCRAFLTT